MANDPAHSEEHKLQDVVEHNFVFLCIPYSLFFIQ